MANTILGGKCRIFAKCYTLRCGIMPPWGCESRIRKVYVRVSHSPSPRGEVPFHHSKINVSQPPILSHPIPLSLILDPPLIIIHLQFTISPLSPIPFSLHHFSFIIFNFSTGKVRGEEIIYVDTPKNPRHRIRKP